mgnify:CR=1 FL=1
MYFESLTPKGGGAPADTLANAINRDFGSFDEFKTQFKRKKETQQEAKDRRQRIREYQDDRDWN